MSLLLCRWVVAVGFLQKPGLPPSGTKEVGQGIRVDGLMITGMGTARPQLRTRCCLGPSMQNATAVLHLNSVPNKSPESNRLFGKLSHYQQLFGPHTHGDIHRLGC